MRHHLVTRGQVLPPHQFECFVLRCKEHVVHHSPVLLVGGDGATWREHRAEVDVVTEGPGARGEVLLSSPLLEGDQPLASVGQTQGVWHQFIRGHSALPRQLSPGIMMSLVEEKSQDGRPRLGVEVSRENDGQDGGPVLYSNSVQFSLIRRGTIKS